MQLFSAEATIYFFKCPWKHKKTPSKVAYLVYGSNFFSGQKLAQISAQITFCFQSLLTSPSNVLH